MEITSQLTAEEKRAIIRDNGGDKGRKPPS